MTAYDLEIQQRSDWDQFGKEGLDLIVDPMVYRSAELFLRGRRASESRGNADQVWASIQRNIDSLTQFFEACILSEQLPIIDYGFTFDSNLDEPIVTLYERCNRESQILVSVHVMGPAYWEANEAATKDLARLQDVTPALRASIVEELNSFDYRWAPRALESANMSEPDRLLASFMLGGLLFGGYAQQAGAGHLLQPKRARLFLATSLRAPSAALRVEDELYQTLRETIRESPQADMAEFKSLPSFLPYLLSQDPESPDDLLWRAIALRDSGEIADYRTFRTGMLRDWREKGRLNVKSQNEIRTILQAVHRKLGGGNPAAVNLKLNVVGLSPPIPSVDVPLNPLFRWVLQELPGRRHSKLLTRMFVADAEYKKLDRHLKALWDAA
jgi:hypothetical protein